MESADSKFLSSGSGYAFGMFDTSPQLDCAGRILKLDRPRVMGIVNVTPDSFSDGGEHAASRTRSPTA